MCASMSPGMTRRSRASSIMVAGPWASTSFLGPTATIVRPRMPTAPSSTKPTPGPTMVRRCPPVISVSSMLLDHLVRALSQRRRDRDPEPLGRLEIQHQRQIGGLLDGEVAGLGAPEDAVHVDRAASVHIDEVRPIGHEAPGVDPLLLRGHRR